MRSVVGAHVLETRGIRHRQAEKVNSHRQTEIERCRTLFVPPLLFPARRFTLAFHVLLCCLQTDDKEANPLLFQAALKYLQWHEEMDKAVEPCHAIFKAKVNPSSSPGVDEVKEQTSRSMNPASSSTRGTPTSWKLRRVRC